VGVLIERPGSVSEIKHDGFRAIAFIDGHFRLISRNGYRFGGFRDLEDALGQALSGRTAILGGEIVCLDGKVSIFSALLNPQAARTICIRRGCRGGYSGSPNTVS
jgi:ATP-dependent DNA ligase